MKNSKLLGFAAVAATFVATTNAFALADANRTYPAAAGNTALGFSLTESNARSAGVDSDKVYVATSSESGLYVTLANKTVAVFGAHADSHIFYARGGSTSGANCPTTENCYAPYTNAYYSVLGQFINVPATVASDRIENRYLSASYDKKIVSASYSFSVAGVPVSIGVDVTGAVGVTLSDRVEGTSTRTQRAYFNSSEQIQHQSNLRTHAYAGIGFGSVAGLRLSADLTVIGHKDRLANTLDGYIYYDEKKVRFYLREDSIKGDTYGLGGSVYVERCLAGSCSKVFSVGSWNGFSATNYAWRDSSITYGPYDGFTH